MKEIWRDIPGYEGRYQVSNLGRVKSLPRVVERKDGKSRRAEGRILKPETAKSGHLMVNLGFGKNDRAKKVHQLVAMAFLGGKPNPRMEVCHNDGNPKNNFVENLRYDTHSENLRDYIRLYGSTYKKVLTVESATMVKKMLRDGVSRTEIARQLQVSRYCVSDIARGRTWAWLN